MAGSLRIGAVGGAQGGARGRAMGDAPGGARGKARAAAVDRDPKTLELPELRPDLRLMEGAPTIAGQRTWLIGDSVQHRFIQIDAATYDLISVMGSCRTVEELIAEADARHAVSIEVDDVVALVNFLYAHDLTVEPAQGGWRQLSRRAETKRPLAMRIASQYLFFRIPLVRPQKFLAATLGLVAPLYTRTFALITLAAALIGLYLVSREWEGFLETAAHLFTWEGAGALALTMIVVKAIHELAHAYTAVRQGSVVTSIGLAFMLMTPLLYTDVTDSWRLKKRRQRLAVDIAGVTVELIIAAYATLLWSFLPDGALRSVCFLLATAGWIMSVAINLNPLMRFDGYYILAELSGIDNLQPRAFATGKWALREVLFGLGRRAPEPFRPPALMGLALYAYAVWIYRLGLYIGIALVVYHFAFKLLGLLLFAFEIIFLISRPIWHELKEWYAMRKEIAARRRSLVTLAVLTGLALLAIVPWSGTVEVPAVVALAERTPIHAPRPAEIKVSHIRTGARVAAGDVLIELAAPELENKLRTVERRLALIRLRLDRTAGDTNERDDIIVMTGELASLQSNRDGLKRELDELVVRATASGVILEAAPELHAGRWIGPDLRLALISGGHDVEATGYLAEPDRSRVAEGAVGVFVADAPLAARQPVVLESISATAVEAIDIPALASIHGGRVSVKPDTKHRQIPTGAQYLVRLTLPDDAAPPSEVRGIVHLEGRPESLLARVWRQTLKVLAREAGA